MQCYRINSKRAIFIVITFLINGVQHSSLSDNNMDVPSKTPTFKESINRNQDTFTQININNGFCPAVFHDECHKISGSCLTQHCNLTENCIYGDTLNVTCNIPPSITCKGEKSFKKQYICRYCYQTEAWEHTCDLKANCNSVAINRSQYTTNCTVNDHTLCLGLRTFNKNVNCNWTGGYRWSTALILGITLGGFGADRFYLGHWQEGIGKLFSFGGLGVWTLIDVILISLHYLGPADGSLYI